MTTMLEDWMQEAANRRMDWLESVLAKLLNDGVPKEDIQIQEHPDLVTVVAVRGEPMCQFQIKFNTGWRDHD
jgi:hypothetical protein